MADSFLGDGFCRGMMRIVENTFDTSDEKEKKTSWKENDKLNVLFVLGPPGAGKGTQCRMIGKKHSNVKHFSAGELLREAKKDRNNKYSKAIKKNIIEGSIVPVEITIKLIEDACALAMKKEKLSLSYFCFDLNE